MNTKKELLDELRNIRMQIALTKPGKEREKLNNLADELHKSYAKVLYNEKLLARKRGNSYD